MNIIYTLRYTVIFLNQPYVSSPFSITVFSPWETGQLGAARHRRIRAQRAAGVAGARQGGPAAAHHGALRGGREAAGAWACFFLIIPPLGG